MLPPIPNSWNSLLAEEIQKPYFQKIEAFLECEKKSGKIIYPESRHIFRALEITPPADVKVVILGQDPYH